MAKGRVIVVSHGEDVDGVASAAMVLRKFPGAEPVFVNYGTYLEALERVAGEAKGGGVDRVFIADLGVNTGDIGDILRYFREISGHADITYVDHHMSYRFGGEFRSVSDYVHCGLDGKGGCRTLCAAELMKQEVLPDDGVADKLARMAHVTDFSCAGGREGGVAKKLDVVIKSLGLEGVERVARKLAGGSFWDGELEGLYNERMSLLQNEEQRVVGGAVVREAAGLRVCYGSSDLLSASTVSRMLKRDKGAGLFVGASSRGPQVVVRRSHTSDFNVFELCDRLEGGGHEDRGGFLYEGEVRGNDPPEGLMKLIEKTIRGG